MEQKDLTSVINSEPSSLNKIATHIDNPDADGLSSQLSLLQLDRYKQSTNQRNWTATWAAIVVSIWMLFVLFILLGNTQRFKLSDTVLVTLLGTTTLNILGLMFIVLGDLFPSGKRNP